MDHRFLKTGFLNAGFRNPRVLKFAALVGVLLMTRSAGTVTGAQTVLVRDITTIVTSLIFAPGFVLAVLADRTVASRTRLRIAIALLLGIAAAVAIHLAWNAHRFGDPLDFGYDAAETIPQLPPQPFRLSDLPRGLIVLLATPGKSLVLWAPVLLLALASARDFWRREAGIVVALAVTLTTGLVFYAAYSISGGGLLAWAAAARAARSASPVACRRAPDQRMAPQRADRLRRRWFQHRAACDVGVFSRGSGHRVGPWRRRTPCVLRPNRPTARTSMESLPPRICAFSANAQRG